jgi:hypothetical protein
MDGFLSNALANLIGTSVGAGLALATALYLSSRDKKIRDRRLIQSVIDRLHRSRALRPNQTGGNGDSPDVTADREYCAKSILATRDRIATVSDELSVRAMGFGALEKMYVACLRYLSRVRRNPNNYVDELMGLREALVVQINALCKSDKEMHRRLPGGADQDEAVDLPPVSVGSRGLSSQ